MTGAGVYLPSRAMLLPACSLTPPDMISATLSSNQGSFCSRKSSLSRLMSMASCRLISQWHVASILCGTHLPRITQPGGFFTHLSLFFLCSASSSFIIYITAVISFNTSKIFWLPSLKIYLTEDFLPKQFMCNTESILPSKTSVHILKEIFFKKKHWLCHAYCPLLFEPYNPSTNFFYNSRFLG